MGSVFYRNPNHVYPTAVRGEGVYLYDADGRRYIDGSGGAAVSCLGHARKEVIEAIHAQLDALTFAHTAFFTNEPQERLASELGERFGDPASRTYFVSGGSEANETAIKLARQYWLSRGEHSKHIVISRGQSYHGNTLGALSVTGHEKRRQPYAPLLRDWPRIQPCYAYRHRREGENEERYALRAAQELQAAIDSVGAENVSAFIAETVVGASLGAVPASAGYFREIRRICDRNEVLLILDEVMAGCGRTGSYYAFEQEGIRPDIVTLAKGLGGGYLPIGAAICSGNVHDTIVAETGSFTHGHTYVGHATSCAAALAVLSVIEQENLLARVEELGHHLSDRLGEALHDHPNVGDIRGRGLLMGIELVRDRQSREPVAAGLGLPAAIKSAAMANGLICYPGGGTADGRDGAHVLLAPPYISEKAHLDELVEKLVPTLDSLNYD